MGIKISDSVKVVKSRPENTNESSIQDRVGEEFTVLKVNSESLLVADGDRFLTVYKDEIELLRSGCEYCTGYVDSRKALIYIEGHYKIHIDENSCINSEEYPPDGVRFNYCPMCGRKLGE